MIAIQDAVSIDLPKGWSERLQTAVVKACSLAHLVIVHARGWAANSINKRVRLATDLERARAEVALLKEEIRIKDARMRKIDPHHRPFYAPTERLAILELRAARGWTAARTARTFLVAQNTIASWGKRLDEPGAGLMRIGVPVNRFPDFVRYVVQRMKTLCPKLGKSKIGEILARCGLHLARTTIGRIIKESPARDDVPDPTEVASTDRLVIVVDTDDTPARVVTAKYPGHVWHVDLTTVPTSAGFWTSWMPHAFAQRWPFCWWLAVAIDHFSRRVVGFAVFSKQPSARGVRTFLGRAIGKEGKAPKYIITDKGSQFWCAGYKKWCGKKGIRPRFGAVGKHGSIAVVERFIRTLKDECTRRILVPFRREKFRTELKFFVQWYNEYRPHTFLDGRTPNEVALDLPPANKAPRLEPRPNWSRNSPCASPQAPVRGDPGERFVLSIAFHGGRKHLPIITLRSAA